MGNTEILKKKLKGLYIIYNPFIAIICFFSVSVEPWNKIKRKRIVLNSSTASKEKKTRILYK